MKKRWILAGIAAIAIAITACTNKKEVVKTDAQKFKEEYESINGTKREKDGKEIRTMRKKHLPYILDLKIVHGAEAWLQRLLNALMN